MFLASEDCSVAVCAFLLPNAFASDLRKLRRLGPGWTGGGDICDQVREIICEATNTLILPSLLPVSPSSLLSSLEGYVYGYVRLETSAQTYTKS